MTKASQRERFVEIFGGSVPELEKPATWDTDMGKVIIPYELKFKKGIDNETDAVFEVDNVRSQTHLRIDYCSTYGLNVRRQLALHRKSGLLISGALEYNFGQLTVGFHTNYDHRGSLKDFNAIGELRDPTNFNVMIIIDKTGDIGEIPPLASARYNFFQNIPIDIAFPLADYDNALKGNYKFYPGFLDYYNQIYFDWIHLSGGKVGIRKSEKGSASTPPSNVTIDGTEWTGFEGTDYEVKVDYISQDNLERGRLRFHRKNKTGEEWMFSVPAWMYSGKFFRKILKEKSIGEFLSQYPVIFWVDNNGEKKVEVFTYNREDLPSKPL